MVEWKELAQEMNRLLRLKTHPIACKRLKKAEELNKIPGVQRPSPGFTFCQLPLLVRTQGMTIGMTRDDFEPTAKGTSLGWRCFRIQGLVPTTDEQVALEAESLTTLWFDNIEESKKQMDSYPVPPHIEALVLAPLDSVTFDPDFILTYANTAQLTLLMNGLQHKNFERFQFFFTGEGSCADGLPQCAVTGKPALSIPCVGERIFGFVSDDEMALAVPAEMMENGVEGMKALEARGVTYPMMPLGPMVNAATMLAQVYPPREPEAK